MSVCIPSPERPQCSRQVLGARRLLCARLGINVGMTPLRRDVLTIGHEDLPAAVLVRLSGEVDLDNAVALRDALDAIIHQRRNIILDCSALSYIDSAGFHVLFRARQELQRYGCQMLVATPSPTVQYAFRIINIEKHFHCVPSVAEALGVLNGRE